MQTVKKKNQKEINNPSSNGALDIAERSRKIGADWFDSLIKKDFPDTSGEDVSKSEKKE
jgi:hypothetical protein